jgi:hypothetical protein
MRSLEKHPTIPNAYIIDSYAEPLFGVQMGAGVLRNVHSEERCAGEVCVMHNPSDHHMRDWPYNWRDDRGLMERICPHGVGHPDPDVRGDLTHGCDGCC